MEKLLKPYDKELMKMAMLKHEETFKGQVYELHRLYQIQKMLMKNIASSRPNGQNQDRWNSKSGNISFNQINGHHGIHQNPRENLDLERPVEEYTVELDGDGVLEIEDEDEIELTLGPKSYYRRRKFETPLNSDSGPSFSSSSTGSSHIKRTNSGIHQRPDTRRDGPNRHKWGLVEVSDLNPSFLSGRRSSSDVEEQLRQDRIKQSPWLFQVLSLNMT